MGVGTYYVCKNPNISKTAGWHLFTIPIGLFLLYQMLSPCDTLQFTTFSLTPERLEVTMRDYLVSALFCMHLIGFCIVSNSFAPSLEFHAKVIRWVAGGTFSLYLFHLPLMHFIAAISPWKINTPWAILALVGTTTIACFICAEFTERRKDGWRQNIQKTLAHFGL